LQQNADYSDFEVILSGLDCLLYQVEHYLVNKYYKKQRGAYNFICEQEIPPY